MNKFLLGIVILILSISFPGCYYDPPELPKTYNFLNEKIIAASFDNAWDDALEWIASHNAPIKNLDKTSGFVATEYNIGANHLIGCFDCGEPKPQLFIKEKYESPSVNISVFIRKIDDKTVRIKILCFYQTLSRKFDYADNYIDTEKIECQSTGDIEREFLTYMINKQIHVSQKEQ